MLKKFVVYWVSTLLCVYEIMQANIIIICREHFLFTSELFLYDHVGIFGFYFKYLELGGFVSFVKFKLFFVPSKFSSDF